MQNSPSQQKESYFKKHKPAVTKTKSLKTIRFTHNNNTTPQFQNEQHSEDESNIDDHNSYQYSTGINNHGSSETHTEIPGGNNNINGGVVSADDKVCFNY
jgi:hypothetical protein